MRRFCVALALITTVVSASLGAQTPAPPAAQGGQSGTPSATAPQAPSRPPSLSGPQLTGVNIRLQITITDTFNSTPQKKTVSMTIMSGQTGMVRTENMVGQGYRVRLNVDAMTTAYSNGLISTRLTVNYQPAPRLNDDGRAISEQARPGTPGQLEESIAVVLTDGKPIILTESADPVSDRKVTLEATATILK